MPEVRLGGKLCLTRHPKYAPGQGQATSYLNPIGPEPGVGYVWMLAADAESLDFEQPQALSIDATETIIIARLYIDSAIAASGLFPGDNNRAYLLTLRDSRFLLDRLTDVNIAINCRARPAPTDSTTAVDPMEFYADTLLAGAAPYSWTEAIGLLWSLCPPSLVGPFPGLPYQPAGVPQDLRFGGVSAWRALHDLLGRVQLTTAYDAAADVFSIVDLSVVQPNLIAVAGYANRLLNDRFPGGSIKARVPATVRVYFQKQAQHWGTESDTPRVGNWQMLNAQYWQDVPSGAATEPGTVVALHDDAPALVDFNGLVLNEIELLARANDRAAQWVSAKVLEIARGSLLIQGIAAPLAVPGSQVSSVLLRNFGDGWATELTLTPNQSVGNGLRAVPVAPVSAETGDNLSPPNLARRTWPNWPRVNQWVKIINSTPDANGLCQGLVARANPALSFAKSANGAAYTSLESCYVAGANGESFTSGRVYAARMNGVASSAAGGWLPLYIAQPATSPMLVQMQADCPYGKSAQAVQISVPQGKEQGDEAAADPPAKFTIFNKLHGLLRKNSIAWVDNDGDGWYSVAALANSFLARGGRSGERNDGLLRGRWSDQLHAG